MQILYKEIALMRATSYWKLLLSRSQKILEQGERTGRLLGWLARERCTTSHIANIRDNSGSLQSDPLQINAQFAKYECLYTSKVDFAPDRLTAFLDPIEFSELSTSAGSCLDAQITV